MILNTKIIIKNYLYNLVRYGAGRETVIINKSTTVVLKGNPNKTFLIKLSVIAAFRGSKFALNF